MLYTLKNKRTLCIALLLLAAGLAGAGYFFFTHEADNSVYLTEAVKQGTIRRVVSATGEIGARQLVTVGAQVSGQILKLHVTIGQAVKKGDLIAEINSVSQENQLATDKARLASYQAQLRTKQISLRIAEQQYKREKALRKRDATSQESLEKMENALVLAQAELAVVEAQIRETTLAVSTDTTNLGYTRITSPLDGIVVAVPVEEGQTVNAVQSAPTIAQIADLGRMEIKIEISEGDITLVKSGMKLSYTLLGEPDISRESILTSLDPGHTTLSDGSYKSTTTASSGSTTTTENAVYYYGKANIDNLDGHLRIGMTVQTEIVVAQAENALLVPLMAVKKDAQGVKTVQVLNAEGKVISKTVQTGMSDGVSIEIKDGLQLGEKVIHGSLSQAEIAEQSTMKGRRRPH